MTVKKKQLVILGSGAASSFTGLLCAQAGLTATLVGTQPCKSTWIKTLPAGIESSLRRAGIWNDFLQLRPIPCNSFYSAWGSDDLDCRDSIMSTHGGGWLVIGHEFETFLLQQLNGTNCSWVPDNLCSAIEVNDGWHLRLKNGSTIFADFVIDTSGRCSAFGRKAGSRRITFDRGVAVVSSYRGRRKHIGNSTLIASGPLGWEFTAETRDASTTVQFTDEDLYDKLLSLAQRVSSDDCTERKVYKASTEILWPFQGANWMAAGDALASVDPISSQGLLRAFKHAESAIECAAQDGAIRQSLMKKYEDEVTDDFFKFLETKRLMYAKEKRWIDLPFWKRRVHKESMTGNFGGP